jgi:hypothetical protein
MRDENEMWKVMWITEDTFIWAEDENYSMGHDFLSSYEIQRVTFTTLNSEKHLLLLAKDRSSASPPVGASSVFLACCDNKQLLQTKVETLAQPLCAICWSQPCAVVGKSVA